jgi:hypothetical protein
MLPGLLGEIASPARLGKLDHALQEGREFTFPGQDRLLDWDQLEAHSRSSPQQGRLEVVRALSPAKWKRGLGPSQPMVPVGDPRRETNEESMDRDRGLRDGN